MNLIPFFSYVIVSTYTPGPANISSASGGVLHGYKNILGFQAGLAVGVFLIMFLSGLVSITLLSIFPPLETVLKFLGAAYILYLAFGVLKATYGFTAQETKPLGFVNGITLQALNPKLVVYAFTVFSAFLAPITNNVVLVALAALFLAVVSFSSTSLWALFGTAIKTYLRNPRLIVVVNILLSLSLVYAALSLIGIL